MPISKPFQGRVLIIDKDETMSFLIRAWLQARGFEVQTLTTETENWRQVVSQEFAVVICDDHLPHVPPLELLHFWQSLDRDGFIIFMGSNPSPEWVLELIHQGAYTYLMKPVTEEKLLPALSQGRKNHQVFLEILNLSEKLSQANQRLQQQTHRLRAERGRLLEQKLSLSFINSFSYSLTTTLSPVKLAAVITKGLAHLVNFTFLGLDWYQAPDNRKIFLSSELDSVGQEIFLRQLKRWHPYHLPWPGASLEFKFFRASTTSWRLSRLPRYLKHLPLKITDVPVGLVVLGGDQPINLSSSHGKLLRTLSPYIAMAMKNALDHEHLSTLAEYDSLTQVMNRRMFDYHMSKEFSASRRYGYPLSLLLLDIDQFKMINDHYGHPVGDEVLKQVAGVLKDEIRQSDILTRYGGDEFALILPHTSLKEAMKLTQRLRLRFQQENFSNGMAIKVTVSAGLADNRRLSEDSEAGLVRQADQALYRAKLKNRNVPNLGSVSLSANPNLTLISPKRPLVDPLNSPSL